MADWIRVDDTSREWPEGAVVVYCPTIPGRRVADIGFRNTDGSIVLDTPFSGVPTHFFYMPPEPK